MSEKGIPQFKEEKAIVVTSYLLKLSGGQCDKYWLNKVLYFIERESLIRSGQPIFFDKLYSAPYGPIVSAINESINSTAYPENSKWCNHFSLNGNYVTQLSEADYSLLSPFEENLIKESYEKFLGWGFSKLKKYFHDLPENTETTSRIPINYEDILKAEGYSNQDIEDTLEELSYLYFLESKLNCV